MIQFSNGGWLIQHASELPQLPEQIETLYADFETGSGKDDTDSLNPWRNCFPVGLAITWDDLPDSFYIPVGHRIVTMYPNIDSEIVIKWFREAVRRCKRWVNHNIKYDVEVCLANNWLEDLPECELLDTITQGKIIDSDRLYKGGYGLDVLSDQWLGHSISHFEKDLAAYLVYYKPGSKRKLKSKDYSRIATDVLGKYACQDVLTNRDIYKYELDRLEPRSQDVWNTEIGVTKVLIDMEREGMKVSEEELLIESFLSVRKMVEIEEKLKELTETEIEPHKNNDCYDFLCARHGLPVIAWTEDEQPSFDAATLKKYLAFPGAPVKELELMIEYRVEHGFYTKFVKPYLKLHINEILHSQYNQAVRTGRMSCSNPNAQQLNKRAKKLVKPRPGNAFLTCDYSQIEFRIIVHYIQDKNAIKAYKDNPWTDFHSWVAEICNIPRKAGKTLNFLMGYGGGKAKATASLSGVEEFVKRVRDKIAELEVPYESVDTVFKNLIKRVAEDAYETYHRKLPSLKPTAKQAERDCRRNHRVPNLYGRYRHLPNTHCHVSFNAACQSSAADLIKERLVAIWKALRGTPIKIIAAVHDSITFEGPEELIRDPRTINDVIWMMEHPVILDKLLVPIRVNYGISAVNWAESDGEERIEATEPAEPFGHLKCELQAHQKSESQIQIQTVL